MSRHAKQIFRVTGLIVAASVIPFAVAHGAAISVASNNSTLTINPTNSAAPFISDWIVDGYDLYGGSPTGSENVLFFLGTNGTVTSVNSLTEKNVTTGSGTATVTYQGPGFTLAITETLTGGTPGSGKSALSETVIVNNTGTAGLDFNLDDVVKPNVDPTQKNETLVTAAGFTSATVTDSAGTTLEATFNPAPLILATSKDGGATYFDTGPGTVTGDVGFAAGWGNLTGAPTIGAGESATYQINETLSGVPTTSTPPVVPAPSSAGSVLLMLGGLRAIAMLRSFRRQTLQPRQYSLTSQAFSQ